MADKNPLVNDLKQQLTAHVLVLLQNPTVLRIVMIVVITAAGIGGIGMPLYNKINRLQAEYAEQKVRQDIIRNRAIIQNALEVYSTRLSSYTLHVEWIPEIKELGKSCGVNVIGVMPAPEYEKKPNPKALQKLRIRGDITGSYPNLLKFIGTLHKRNNRILISNFKIFQFGGEYRLGIDMAAIMNPVKEKIRQKKKSKQAEEKPAPSATAAHQAPEAAPEPAASKALAVEGKDTPGQQPAQAENPAGAGGKSGSVDIATTNFKTEVSSQGTGVPLTDPGGSKSKMAEELK